MEAADVGLLSQEDIVFTTAKGVIEQTNKYGDNLFQIYHIITKNPLAIKFTRISLEKGKKGSCNDYVKLAFNNFTSDELCGNRKRSADWTSGWKFINSSSLSLTFVTDYSIAGNGFRFQWQNQEKILSPIALKFSLVNNRCTMSSFIDKFTSLMPLAKEQVKTRDEQRKVGQLDKNIARIFRRAQNAYYFNSFGQSRKLLEGCSTGQRVDCYHLRFSDSPTYSELVGQLAMLFHDKMASCTVKSVQLSWFKRINKLIQILES